MAIEITHVRFGSVPKNHQSIVSYKWTSPGEAGTTDKPTLVQWVENNGEAYVGTGANRVRVGVVREQGTQPYLRTYADGKWSNNLLSLPEF
ncbi:DUF3892 domain-containing protein [Agromyces seonyuensis]|uniref:DUF3892 domain-containing protein n=1 Tax=Agromyces seonyuensis TaxID=2662446 RepID=A0A6I4P623_9MICO|nr:DUF3892 domain-containing protein [Agromyces seonyuensis]